MRWRRIVAAVLGVLVVAWIVATVRMSLAPEYLATWALQVSTLYAMLTAPCAGIAPGAGSEMLAARQYPLTVPAGSDVQVPLA